MEAIQLESFGGTYHEDARTWLENLTAYCDRKNIVGADRPAIMKPLLLGEAKFWYNELEDDVRDHWDQFSEAFEEKCITGTTETERRLFRSLRARKFF